MNVNGDKIVEINCDDNHVNMIKQLMVNINFFTGDEFSEKDENDLSNEG